MHDPFYVAPASTFFSCALFILEATRSTGVRYRPRVRDTVDHLTTIEVLHPSGSSMMWRSLHAAGTLESRSIWWCVVDDKGVGESSSEMARPTFLSLAKCANRSTSRFA